jgi:hypothetical protein
VGNYFCERDVAMGVGAGILNCFVLLGISLFCFRLCWALFYAIVHGILKVVKGGRNVTLHLFELLWGYFLTSQVALVLVQAQQTREISGTGYIWIVTLVFTLFILSNRIGDIWIAERKLDVELQKIVKQQHVVVAGIWVWGILAFWFWPEGWHLGHVQWSVAVVQKALSVPVLGFCLSVFGIVYALGLVRRILKFIRIGPKGLPPFPDSIRK